MKRVSTGVLVGGLLGWALALAPGQLPRPAVLTAVIGTALMLVGMGVGAVSTALVRRVRRREHRGTPTEVVAGASVLAAAILVASLKWQVEVADGLGTAAPGIGWVAAVAGVPLAVAIAVVTLPGRVWAIGALLAALIGGTAAQAHASTPDVPADRALTYSRLDGTSDLDARARTLIDRWAASGEPTDNVVIVVPTGSGWVDASAVTGFEDYFRGDVSFLSMQYSDVPSWKAYVRSPATAGDSATAVVRALDQRLRHHRHRPRIYLFGQSLGAIGADAARAWAARNHVEVAGTVLSGPPANTIEPLEACAPRVVLVNDTDPVADFDTTLLWRAPHRTADTVATGAPRHDLPWVPGLSLIGTAIDLAVALDGPVGSGHHYGVEQGLAVGELPTRCQTTGPRAAS